MLPTLRALARSMFVVAVVGIIGAAAVAGFSLYKFGRDLPDLRRITDYVPAVGTKVYDANGTLMAEFEAEHRIPVAIGQVPRLVINAFLAAEDRDFYTHKGVDPDAILRAATADIMRFRRGQRPVGASTITQQVVRHFLLSREISIARKVKEALLAYQLDSTLSKDRILEIYLNEIYFGMGAYGVAAAADTYFQKPLDRLTPAEAAYLAALPKAPNNYHPVRDAAAAKARRDWVLAGMAEMGWLSGAEAKKAMGEPLAVNLRPEPQREPYGYFAEEVRRGLIGRFGEKAVYEGGLTIRTSYNPAQQHLAEAAFRRGLVDYDRRHGWRGPLARLGDAAAAERKLAEMADPPGIGNWRLAAVTDIAAGGAAIALRGGGVGHIPIAELRWARPTIKDQRLGRAVRKVTDVLSVGDIVLVEPLGSGKERKAERGVQNYGLRQIPDVSGGVVVMDPKTGRIFALVGGWSFQQSQFNRSTQAMRQPGSAIKPFVYLTALQHGFSPGSWVEDSPLEISQGPGLPPWRPANYDGDSGGMMTLADALVYSRNLVTARVALDVGLPAVAQTVQAFDIMDKMPLYPSMSLGAGETTLLRLTNAYAMLDNGGHWLLPSVIDVVQDRDGRIIYQKGVKGCPSCFISAGRRSSDSGGLYRAVGPAAPSSVAVPNAAYAADPVLYAPTKSDPLADPQAIGDIVEILQGVIDRGTGTLVKPVANALAQPLAGKTGTTNGYFDAWFVGFSPDLAAGTYVGFDEPRTLGDSETGGRIAAAIFRDFVKDALKGAPAKPFPQPGGSDKVRPQEVKVVTGDTYSGGAVRIEGERSRPASESDEADRAPPTLRRGRQDEGDETSDSPEAPAWDYATRHGNGRSAAYDTPGYIPPGYMPPPYPYDASAGPAYPAPVWGGARPWPPVPQYVPSPRYRPRGYSGTTAGPSPGYGTGGLY